MDDIDKIFIRYQELQKKRCQLVKQNLSIFSALEGKAESYNVKHLFNGRESWRSWELVGVSESRWMNRRAQEFKNTLLAEAIIEKLAKLALTTQVNVKFANSEQTFGR